jgi:transposase
MLTVEDYEKIRKAVLRNGMSRREAARTFGHGRDTIRKILAGSSPPGYRRRKEAASPLLDPVKSLIDAWLEDERCRGVKRKQRSSAKKIWERLRDEYDFQGSVYPIRRYLRQKRQSSVQEAYFPLVFSPGEEGQVDWGVADVFLAGRLVTVHLFCLRLCYSRATYVRAYLSEKLECFLDGHVRAFRFLGGSVWTLAYDNLKAAVTWIGPERQRRLNDLFIALRSHYLFDSRFCNVDSGHEKGRVENLVKLAQKDFLAGAPSFEDLAALNAYLEGCCIEDLQRLAPQSEQTRGELFEQEKAFLLPLPTADFEACIRRSTFVSKQALVQHETNFYSAPVCQVFHQVTLKVFAERIEIVSGTETVAVHRRCWGRHEFFLDYSHYLALLASKPGGLNHARPFQGEPWGADLDRLRIELEYRYGAGGVRQFIDVLLLLTEYPEASVKAAVGQCVGRRAFSSEAVKSVLDYQPPTSVGPLDLSRYPLLQVETDGVRDAGEYDQALLDKEDVA